MKCQECKKFDEETKFKLNDFSHEDEIALISILLSEYIYRLQEAYKKQNPNDGRAASLKMRMELKKGVDFSSQAAGKYFIALSDEKRSQVLDELAKKRIVINMNHGKCPHGEAS